MHKLLVSIPAIAGAIMFAWALGNAIELADVCESARSGTSGWAAVGIFLVVVLGAVSATMLARRLPGLRALLGVLVTLAAMVVGAEAGYALALASIGCEGWGEGPGLTISLFAVPAALVGYALGWILRQTDMRAPSG